MIVFLFKSLFFWFSLPVTHAYFSYFFSFHKSIPNYYLLFYLFIFTCYFPFLNFRFLCWGFLSEKWPSNRKECPKKKKIKKQSTLLKSSFSVANARAFPKSTHAFLYTLAYLFTNQILYLHTHMCHKITNFICVYVYKRNTRFFVYMRTYCKSTKSYSTQHASFINTRFFSL